MRRSVILAFVLVLPAAVLAAAQPSALSQISAGMWEISGAPGQAAPVRECIGDVLSLTQFEHRGQSCTRSVLKDGPSSARIDYKCGAGEFGETKVDLLTPRSLRISTQGISDQLPFSYVLQARRVGECTKNPSSTRH